MNVNVTFTLDVTSRFEALLMNALVRLPWLLDPVDVPAEQPPPQPRVEVPDAKPVTSSVREPAPTGARTSPWTKERNDVLRTVWADGGSLDAAVEQVNRLVGPPINRSAVRAIITYRKLQRGTAVSPTPTPVEPVAAEQSKSPPFVGLGSTGHAELYANRRGVGRVA